MERSKFSSSADSSTCIMTSNTLVVLVNYKYPRLPFFIGLIQVLDAMIDFIEIIYKKTSLQSNKWKVYYWPDKMR